METKKKISDLSNEQIWDLFSVRDLRQSGMLTDVRTVDRKEDSVSVYIAGGWIHRVALKNTIQLFRDKGYTVTSGWIERENGANTPEMLARDAAEDFREIEKSDVLVAIMDDPLYAYRGSFTEIGYALGLNLKVFIVCPLHKDTEYSVLHSTNRSEPINVTYSHNCATNVFFWHPSILRVSTVEEVLFHLSPNFKEFNTVAGNRLSMPNMLLSSDLLAPRLPGYEGWISYFLPEDHSNWGPVQDPNQWTKYVLCIPKNAIGVQITSSDQDGEISPGAWHAKIMGVQFGNGAITIHLKWWGEPWQFYVGWKIA